MLQLPKTETLVPQKMSAAGAMPIYSFATTTTPLVKVDLLFEAGGAYQPQPLCANAACKMSIVATRSMPAPQLAEFFDYRGVAIDATTDDLQSSITLYMARHYAEEVLPVVAEMFAEVAFAPEDLTEYLDRRRSELATLNQRTSHQARKLFYTTLYGSTHPIGRYATAADADRLMPETVRKYIAQHYQHGLLGVVLSGSVDDALVNLTQQCFAPIYGGGNTVGRINTLAVEPIATPYTPQHHPMPDAVQTSLRIGRILPLAWSDTAFAQFTILNTLLGGYFGSRLMTNLREDKGYTYGIYSRSQINRGTITFYITADVAAEATQGAIVEVQNELQRLCDTPPTTDELQLVKNVVVGDFMRSVDGVFELSTRFCDMLATDVDERFTANLSQAIASCSPADITALAQRLLAPSQMLVCTAGSQS